MCGMWSVSCSCFCSSGGGEAGDGERGMGDGACMHVNLLNEGLVLVWLDVWVEVELV